MIKHHLMECRLSFSQPHQYKMRHVVRAILFHDSIAPLKSHPLIRGRPSHV